MDFSSDENDAYKNLMGSSFGSAEASMGQDAYQQNVRSTKIINDLNEKQVMKFDERYEREVIQFEAQIAYMSSTAHLKHSKAMLRSGVAGLFYALTFVLLLCSIPLVVMLWHAAV